MLELQHPESHELVPAGNRSAQPKRRVIIALGERFRFLVYIPKGLLRIGKKQVSMKRKHALDQAVTDADLKLSVGIVLGQLPARKARARDEVVILVNSERRNRLQPAVDLGRVGKPLRIGMTPVLLGFRRTEARQDQQKGRYFFPHVSIRYN